ncbi:hypothetical protein AB8U03_06530 [Clostridium sp. Mt-5]|uniref:Uncharacterized protein n=1 Tax=Clostridium moutaii TaxID=3240932 RepID=A0ABV4BQE8_9CLOT
MKRYKAYLSYLIGILLIVYVIVSMENVIISYRNANFKYNNLYIIISVILAAMIGVILGLERFAEEIKKPGIWKINWGKVIIICLPMTAFSIYLILYFENLLPYFIVQNFVLILSTNSVFTYLIFGIILGHGIIGSFYKSDESKT